MAADPRTAVVPISGPQPLALPPFREWTYEDAAVAVAAEVHDPETYKARRAYGEDGDHWQDGAGFIGPMPLAGDPHGKRKKEQVEAQFAPNDACGEGLYAVADAFADEAQLSVVPLEPLEEGESPPAEVQDKIDEAEALLTTLWDRVRLHEALKRAIRRGAWAGHASLRWWIPPGRAIRGADGAARLPRAATFEDASDWLALSAPMPDAAAIVTDEDTQERAAVYLDAVKEEGNTVRRAQVSFLEGDQLIIRTVYEGGDRDDEVMELAADALPLAEMRANVLLTRPVIATQRQLNYFETVLTRTVEAAGFPERYIGNAEPSGTPIPLREGETPRGPVREIDGVLYHIPAEPRLLGASVTTELVGLVTDTEDGKQVRATPSVERFEPTDPAGAIHSAEHARSKVLHMMRQGHRAGSSKAQLSGFAYIQARSAFLKDLQNRKGAAEGALRDLLTSALALMEALTGQRGYFTDYVRVTVDMHVDAGPRDPMERTEDRNDVDAGLLSRETAMARGGVEDILAEQERIEDGGRLALLKEAAEVFEILTRSTTEAAAIRAMIAAGVDEEIATALAARDTDNGGWVNDGAIA